MAQVNQAGANQDIQGSEENQEALEQRFQDLYVAMMEKKVSFKEATEPFRTDNENSSKG
ncbi:MAG: hypothetical protein AAF841_00010 [Pseudomonadota bacterium]